LEKALAASKERPHAISRNQRLHSIGNLTLVSHKLNPSLSHAALAGRGKGVQDKVGKALRSKRASKLQLNARLICAIPKRWDESKIDSRASELFGMARAIWIAPPTHQKP